MPWYKGNLHCHSTNSDGRARPVDVAHFYRTQGHDFVGLSDHNRYTSVDVYAGPAGIVGVPCCEYSGEGRCHVLSVGVERDIAPSVIRPDSERPKKVVLQEGIDLTLEAGGVPVVCHPNWVWTLDSADLLALNNCRHFEICNASPDCNSKPIPGYEPGEKLWDTLLTAGQRYFGLANDDAHEYYAPPTPRSPMGGRGYNVVKAASLTWRNIVEAVRKGHFYATTGITLATYKVTPQGIELAVDTHQNERVAVQYFGAGGRQLQLDHSDSSSYTFNGDEIYVRARIASTAGLWAWTQPVFLDSLNDAVKWTAEP